MDLRESLFIKQRILQFRQVANVLLEVISQVELQFLKILKFMINQTYERPVKKTLSQNLQSKLLKDNKKN